jgi:hypothetical protein
MTRWSTKSELMAFPDDCLVSSTRIQTVLGDVDE